MSERISSPNRSGPDNVTLLRVYTGWFRSPQIARIEAETSALGRVPPHKQLIVQLFAPAVTVDAVAAVPVAPVRERAPIEIVSRLRRILAENQPRVVYCHGLWSVIWVSLACSRRVPSTVIYEIHGAAAFEALHSRRGLRALRFAVLYLLESIACVLADKLVLVSDAYVDYYPATRLRPRLTVPRLVRGRRSATPPADVAAFVARSRREGRPVVVYAGGAEFYQLPDKVVAFMRRLVREKNFSAVILANDPDVFRRLMAAEELAGPSWLISFAPRDEVRAALALCDIGVLLRSNAVLNKVASPTKLYEYLDAGLSIATTMAIGEAVRAVERSGGGVVFRTVDEAIDAPDAPERCVAALQRSSRVAPRGGQFEWGADEAFHDFLFSGWRETPSIPLQPSPEPSRLTVPEARAP